MKKTPTRKPVDAYVKETFKKQFKKLLKLRGFTRNDFAEKSGIPKSTVDKWLSPNGTMPDHDKYYKICEILECETDYLYGLSDVPIREFGDIRKKTGLTYEAVEALIARKQLIDNNTSDQVFVERMQEELSILNRIVLDNENILQQICEYIFGVTALTYCDDNKEAPSIPWWKRLPTIEADNGNIFAINLPIDKTTYRAIKIGYIQECLDSLATDTNNTGYFSSAYLSQP